MTGVRAIVFDVGETLVDESRAWSEAAQQVSLTPFTLMGALGSLIAERRDHREVWGILGVEPPTPPDIKPEDLYEDALPCLSAARAAGLVIGVAGNQPRGMELSLAASAVEADFIASSASWGVSKPSGEFFDRVVEAAGCSADEILYVGDRLDNDVLPAREAGLRTAFIRRGPWGYLHALWPEAELADYRIDSLRELEFQARER